MTKSIKTLNTIIPSMKSVNAIQTSMVNDFKYRTTECFIGSTCYQLTVSNPGSNDIITLYSIDVNGNTQNLRDINPDGDVSSISICTDGIDLIVSYTDTSVKSLLLNQTGNVKTLNDIVLGPKNIGTNLNSLTSFIEDDTFVLMGLDNENNIKVHYTTKNLAPLFESTIVLDNSFKDVSIFFDDDIIVTGSTDIAGEIEVRSMIIEKPIYNPVTKTNKPQIGYETRNVSGYNVSELGKYQTQMVNNDILIATDLPAVDGLLKLELTIGDYSLVVDRNIGYKLTEEFVFVYKPFAGKIIFEIYDLTFELFDSGEIVCDAVIGDILYCLDYDTVISSESKLMITKISSNPVVKQKTFGDVIRHNNDCLICSDKVITLDNEIIVMVSDAIYMKEINLLIGIDGSLIKSFNLDGELQKYTTLTQVQFVYENMWIEKTSLTSFNIQGLVKTVDGYSNIVRGFNHLLMNNSDVKILDTDFVKRNNKILISSSHVLYGDIMSISKIIDTTSTPTLTDKLIPVYEYNPLILVGETSNMKLYDALGSDEYPLLRDASSRYTPSQYRFNMVGDKLYIGSTVYYDRIGYVDPVRTVDQNTNNHSYVKVLNGATNLSDVNNLIVTGDLGVTNDLTPPNIIGERQIASITLKLHTKQNIAVSGYPTVDVNSEVANPKTKTTLSLDEMKFIENQEHYIVKHLSVKNHEFNPIKNGTNIDLVSEKYLSDVEREVMIMGVNKLPYGVRSNGSPVKCVSTEALPNKITKISINQDQSSNDSMIFSLQLFKNGKRLNFSDSQITLNGSFNPYNTEMSVMNMLNNKVIKGVRGWYFAGNSNSMEIIFNEPIDCDEVRVIRADFEVGYVSSNDMTINIITELDDMKLIVNEINNIENTVETVISPMYYKHNYGILSDFELTTDPRFYTENVDALDNNLLINTILNSDTSGTNEYMSSINELGVEITKTIPDITTNLFVGE